MLFVALLLPSFFQQDAAGRKHSSSRAFARHVATVETNDLYVANKKKCPRSRIEIRPTALPSLLTLTLDSLLRFQYLASNAKIKVNGQAVPKLRVETDGHDRL